MTHVPVLFEKWTLLENVHFVAVEVIAAVYSNSYFWSRRHQVHQIMGAEMW